MGYVIKATNSQGITFTTRTGRNGHYILYLPQGSYSISVSIPETAKHLNVLNNNRSIKTNTDENTNVDFEVFVAEKQVEFKKFTAS